MSNRNVLIDFLGLRRNIVGLLLIVILVEMGERMAERFLPIYLLAIGGSAITIGLLNGMDNLLSAFYSFPGGYLTDRFGTKKALLLFNLMAITGFAIVILFPYWQAVLIGAVFFIAWSAISLPATMNLLSKTLPMNKRTMGVSLHSIVRRFPMALGPVLGGLFIGYWGEKEGVRYAFIIAILMTLLAIVIQEKLLSSEKIDSVITPVKNPMKLYYSMSPKLKNLLLSDILIRFCEQIPYAFVVVWAMKNISEPVSAFQFGLLTTIEMTTAVLIYIPVAYYADKLGKRPFIIITFIFFTLFPLSLIYSQSYALLIPAFILRGLKEFGEPARKALIIDLAPENQKGSMFGLYYLIRDSIVSLAAFGGAFLWQISPMTNFVTAFLFGLLGTIWFILFGKDTEIQRN